MRSAVDQREGVIGLVEPENQAKYRGQLSIGFGLYLDAYLKKEGLWPTRLAGLADILQAISDPDGYADRRAKELRAANAFRSLTWNGTCDPHVKNLPQGFTGDEKGKAMPAPFYFWYDSNLRRGRRFVPDGEALSQTKCRLQRKRICSTDGKIFWSSWATCSGNGRPAWSRAVAAVASASRPWWKSSRGAIG